MNVRDFLKLELAGSVVLFLAALLAIALNNSPFAENYQAVFQSPIKIGIGFWHFDQPVLFWINECLMTLFFLLVGLELKREFLVGELKGSTKIILPGIAAFGGMLIPAIIYSLFNLSLPTLKGWAIPVATDIAFALGVLSLFGRRVPLGLKLFLMALAIFDDLGAIIIIAIYHTHAMSYPYLLGAVMVLLILFVLNRLNIRSLWLYMLIGIALWFCVLQSGIHATIAGVLLALMVPIKGTPMKTALEEELHPWVAFGVMPLFALANAGLSFNGLDINYLVDPLVLGIVAGLFLGKQLGVFSFAGLLIKMGWAKLPKQSSWLELYGVACLCGIGFTMSLFLGTLAFQEDNSIYLIKVRLSVLLASVISGLVGAVILYFAFLRKEKKGGRKFE